MERSGPCEKHPLWAWVDPTSEGPACSVLVAPGIVCGRSQTEHTAEAAKADVAMDHDFLAGTWDATKDDAYCQLCQLEAQLTHEREARQREQAICAEMQQYELAILLFCSWLDLWSLKRQPIGDIIGAWEEARHPGCHGWKFFSKDCVESHRKRLFSNPGSAIIERLAKAEAAAAELRVEAEKPDRAWHYENHPEGPFETCGLEFCVKARKRLANPGSSLLTRLEAAQGMADEVERILKNLNDLGVRNWGLAAKLEAWKAANKGDK